MASPQEQIRKLRIRFNNIKHNQDHGNIRSLGYLITNINALKKPIEQLEAAFTHDISWFERFKNFFGYYSNPEAKVFFELHSEFKKFYNHYQYEHRKLWASHYLLHLLAIWFGFDILKFIYNKVTDAFDDNKHKFKLAAFRLMGKKEYKGQDVNGTLSSLVTKSLKNNLKNFRVESDLKGKVERQFLKIESQLELLQYFSEQTEMLGIMSKVYHPQKTERILTDISNNVLDYVFKLKTNESIILPSGFLSEEGNHATCYQITKLPNAQYRLSLYNTGGGVIEQILKQGSFLEGVRNVFNMIFYDTTFEMHVDFDREHLNTNLIKQIFQSHVHREETINQAARLMLSPFQTLKDAGYAIELGNYYDLQTNGTCTESCILAWLSSELPTDIFTLFKIFLSQRSISELADFSQTEDAIKVSAKVKNTGRQAGSTLLCGHQLIDHLMENGKALIINYAESLPSTINTIDPNIDNEYQHLVALETMPQTEIERTKQAMLSARQSYASTTQQQASQTLMAPGFFARKEAKQTWQQYQKAKEYHEHTVYLSTHPDSLQGTKVMLEEDLNRHHIWRTLC